jgi:hypothetical protein
MLSVGASDALSVRTGAVRFLKAFATLSVRVPARLFLAAFTTLSDKAARRPAPESPHYAAVTVASVNRVLLGVEPTTNLMDFLMAGWAAHAAAFKAECRAGHSAVVLAA